MTTTTHESPGPDGVPEGKTARPALPYLDAMSDYLRDSTDTVLVVEGTELPCHMLILAQQSRVFSGMADLLTIPGTKGAEQPRDQPMNVPCVFAVHTAQC